MQGTQNRKKNHETKKNKAAGLTLSDVKTNYKATIFKTLALT